MPSALALAGNTCIGRQIGSRFRNAIFLSSVTFVNRITPLILAIALFMEMMDATVIATSLPAIAADIGTTPIALKLAMTSYLVALAMFIPISGVVADRFGAKNVFRGAIGIFMLGSLACAFADSLQFFVGARFFQGMGGAMMVPLARLVLVRSTPKKDLVSAMAWLTVPALIGPLMGPPIGGFLTTFWSWHWIFLINIPIGLAGIVAATIYLPEIEPQPRHKTDWLGFFLTATAFSGLLFGLSVVSLPVLPPIYGVAAMLVGAIALWLYFAHAKRIEFPILNPKIFERDTFRHIAWATFAFRIAMGTTPFLLPLMLQVGFGYSPFEAGMVMLFGAVGAISAKSFVKPLYARFGYKRIALLATLGSTLVFLMSATFRTETPIFIMMATMLCAGLVRSTYFTGSNAVQFGEVSDEEKSQASAIFSVLVQLGLATGVAVAGIILEVRAIFVGHDLSGDDFRLAFYIVAGLSLFAIIPLLRLKADAGEEVSGHHTARRGDSPGVGGA